MAPNVDRGEYRPIFEALLDGPQFQRLTSDARWTWVALKIKCKAAGIIVIPGYREALCEWTGLEADARDRALAQLEDEGWIRIEKSVLWVVRGLEFEPSHAPTNPKMRTYIRRVCNSLPSLPIVDAFRSHYAEWFVDEKGADEPVDGPAPSPIDTHSKGDRKAIESVSSGSLEGIEGGLIPPRFTATATATTPNNSSPAPAHAHAFMGDSRVVAFFTALPDAKHKQWRARIETWLGGDGWREGPKPTPDQLAEGLLEASCVNDAGQITPSLVIGCTVKVMQGTRTPERGAPIRANAPPSPELLDRAQELTHLVLDHSLARCTADKRRDILRDLVPRGWIADAAATEAALACIAPLPDLVRPGRTFDDALRLAVARLEAGLQEGRPLPPSVRPRPTFELVS